MREVKSEGSVVISEPVPVTDESAYGPFMIHGIDSNGTKMTIVDAITVGWRMLSDPMQRLQGAQAVIGPHLSSREHLFQGFRLRLQHIDSWRSFIADPAWISKAPLKAGGHITFEAPVGQHVWLDRE